MAQVMMDGILIGDVETKNNMTESSLPVGGYSVNPYVGCTHACYCTWAEKSEVNRIYHDTEWGIPVHDDRHMFEHLTLECLQCGLSWDLILKKREIFRRCFDNFDFDKIAAYNDTDVERILNTEGMIRSPRKVQAVINNARCYQKVREEHGSFCNYIWAYS